MTTQKKYYIVRNYLSKKVVFKSTSEKKVKYFIGKSIVNTSKEVNKATYDSLKVIK
jgi:hypothetical protein